jgi:hypothetical protein
MWLLALACNKRVVALEDDSVELPSESPVEDTEGPSVERFEGAGGGFGTRLAYSHGGILVAAPWFEDRGEITLLGEDDRVSLGARSHGLGLASDGSVTRASTPLDEVDLRGGRARYEGGWLETSTLGVYADDVLSETPSRALSVTRVEDRVVAGLVDGVWSEEAWIAEADPGSELGLSACSADLDGDGLEDLAVGAPGVDEVHVWLDLDLAPTVLQGPEGRFGQSLSCGAGLLAVGAPLAEDGAGAVWLIEDLGLEDPILVGEPGDLLGVEVLLIGEALYAGAPGGPGSPGAVLVRR